MDYTEDNQNSAPGSVQASKLNAARKGPDSQSVTKRYFFPFQQRLRLIQALTDFSTDSRPS